MRNSLCSLPILITLLTLILIVLPLEIEAKTSEKKCNRIPPKVAQPNAGQNDQTVKNTSNAKENASKNPAAASSKKKNRQVSEFPWDVFKLLPKNQNVFFSPYGTETLLSILAWGADGQTAKELQKLLGCKNEDLQSMACRLKSVPAGVITQYNGGWYHQKGTLIDIRYQAVLKAYYGLQFQPLDIESNPNIACQQINKSIAEQTENRINKLFSDLSSDTKLVLVNVLSFKTQWEKEFYGEKSSLQPFKVASKKTVNVMMMINSGVFNYGKVSAGNKGKETLEILELPYKNGTSMFVFLPDEKTPLVEFEKSFSMQNFEKWREKMEFQNGLIRLPRMNFATELDLKPCLIGAGLKTLFSKKANLQHLTGADQFCVGEIRQNTMLDVNETGTTAIAATGAAVVSRSLQNYHFKFIANRPFFFLIYEPVTQTVLFMGRLTTPNVIE